jgi:polyisoprenoid-binding protein YceI
MTTRWEIDSSHSGIHFSVRHMVISKVRGRFTRWTGTLLAEGTDAVQTSVEVAIDASSIDTGVEKRDAHLRSTDFLDIENHAEITFKSKRVERRGRNELKVVGDLTIRGVTREVVLDVEVSGRTTDPWGNERAGFTAKGSVNREDFGLKWNQILETGGVLVGERVDIEIEVEAVRQSEAMVA